MLQIKRKIEAKPDATIFEIINAEDKKGFGFELVRLKELRSHFHCKTVEVYILVTGKAEIQCNENATILENHGDTVTIQPSNIHSARSLGQEPAWIAVLSLPGWTRGDHYRIVRKKE